VDVVVRSFTNLRGCRIGDGTQIGTFVLGGCGSAQERWSGGAVVSRDVPAGATVAAFRRGRSL
jgi:hypothetical protein